METDRGRPVEDRLDSLDGMRAIAIVAVLLLHLDRPHFPGGSFGVDVFFVLSAYLITSILLREVQLAGKIRFGAFYWRRFVRLMPALVLWIALFATPAALLAHQADDIPWSVSGSFLYFSDFLQAWTDHVADSFDQSWSLAVEEQFYLVWPLLLAALAGRLTSTGQRRTMVGFIAVSVVVWALAGNYFLPTGHLVPLSLGCWAATWSVSANHRGRWTRVLRDPRLGLVCVVALAAALFLDPSLHPGHEFALIVALATTGLLLHCTLNSRSLASRLLASRIPRWIGERSYGIYLYGLTLLVLVPLATHQSLRLAGPLAIVATGVVVAVSFRFVETPLRVRGRHWLERRGDGGSSATELGLRRLAADRG